MIATRALLVALAVAALAGSTSVAGSPDTARLAATAGAGADSAYARILVTGSSKVALVDPQGRRCEWTAKGVVAQIPGCSEDDVTEPTDSGGTGEPAIMFSLRQPTTGEYVVEVGGSARVEVTCNAEWHGASESGCSARATRTLARGLRTRWGVRWPAGSQSDTCRVVIRSLPSKPFPRSSKEQSGGASRPASR